MLQVKKLASFLQRCRQPLPLNDRYYQAKQRWSNSPWIKINVKWNCTSSSWREKKLWCSDINIKWGEPDTSKEALCVNHCITQN